MALTNTEEGENAYKTLHGKLSGRFHFGNTGLDVAIKFQSMINYTHDEIPSFSHTRIFPPYDFLFFFFFFFLLLLLLLSSFRPAGLLWSHIFLLTLHFISG
jgi:hypothetical protein